MFDRDFALSMGPQRSGTSWLDRYLRSRGDVCMPTDVKEVFFFDRHFERGKSFYKSHFKPETFHKLVMEISTTSFDHPEAPERVYNLFGNNLRMICPLRHPAIRSYSLYLHLLRYGIARGTLKQAAEQTPQILYSSRYAEHLENWYRYFDQEKIKIVYQENLEKCPNDYVSDVCEALGLPKIDPNPHIVQKYNVTATSRFHSFANISQRTADLLRSYRLYPVINFAKAIGLKQIIFGAEIFDPQRGSIGRDEYEWLCERLQPEILKLERLLGYKIDCWEQGFVQDETAL